MAEATFSRTALTTWTAVAVLGAGLAVASSADWYAIAVGATVLAVAQVVRAPTPSGHMLDVGLAVAAAVPLLTDDLNATGAIYSLGLLGAWLVLLGNRHRAATSLLPGVLALAAYAVSFFGIVRRLEAASNLPTQSIELIGVAGGGLAWFIAMGLTRTVLRNRGERLAFRYLWLQALEDWPVVVGLVSAGALFAFSWPLMRWWAVPMSVMAYGFSHLAFVRYHGTKVTYRQTIRALARIPEAAGLAPEGHSVRSTDIAMAMGRELGLAPREASDLEFSALMHDIGRITLNEPAILKAGYSDEDIARWGSEIVKEAPYLNRVAAIIRQQHQPYRRPGEVVDEDLPLASKVIRVASAYDQATLEMGLSPLEAIETLHRGAAYDFDPEVVKALRRALVRSSVIAH
ncbi:MAG: HD domain-containing protein [Acidimicrobiia bacterium]|nr:HD domain-containing protein [Acidimicrobiia bacterium]